MLMLPVTSYIQMARLSPIPKTSIRGGGGGGIPSWNPTKEVKIHGASVRATRKPLLPSRLLVALPLRLAERRLRGLLSQEPPRNTRFAQFPP